MRSAALGSGSHCYGWMGWSSCSGHCGSWQQLSALQHTGAGLLSEVWMPAIPVAFCQDGNVSQQGLQEYCVVTDRIFVSNPKSG